MAGPSTAAYPFLSDVVAVGRVTQPLRFWFLIEWGAVVNTLHRRLGPVTQPPLYALKSWSKHAFARLQWPSTLGYAKPVSKEEPSEGLKLVETRVQQLRLLHPPVHDVGSETSKTANGHRKLIQRQPGLGECILNAAHIAPGVSLAHWRGKGLHRDPEEHDSIRRRT
jgi:hypothetical protein